MTKRDEADPAMLPEASTDPSGEPFEATSGAVAVVREAPTAPDGVIHVPYDASTGNEEFNRIANALTSAPFPPPLYSPTTDGELTAQYSANDVALPARNLTPVPEPPVLLNCTGDLTPARDAINTPTDPIGTPLEAPKPPRASVRTSALPREAAPVPEAAFGATTVQSALRRTRLMYLVVGMAVSAVVLFLFVLIGRSMRPRVVAPPVAATIIPQPPSAPAIVAPPPPVPAAVSASPPITSEVHPAASTAPSRPRDEPRRAPPSSRINRDLP